MNEPREWTGHWWRPDDPDDVLAGVLKYAPGQGGQLVLIGHWSESASRRSSPAGSHPDEPIRWPAILGKAGDSLVTLVEPWVANTRGPFSLDPPVSLRRVASA